MDMIDKIVICSEYLPHHSWMAFAAWYSIQKNIPDAAVVLHIQNTNYSEHLLFNWATKLSVKKVKDIPPDYFRIESSVMAIRELGAEVVGPTDVKSELFPTFVNYSNGCGKFNVADWINNFEVPFYRAVDRWTNDNLTVNEYRVLKLWSQFYPVYTAAS